METTTRTILVTGASSGIGLAVSRRLLTRGHRVVGLSRRSGSSTIDDPHFHGQAIDLTDLDALPGRLHELTATLPASFADVSGLVCCAGRGRFGSLEEFSCRQIRELMDLNFTSQACLVRTLLPLLKQHALDIGTGHILFIGSESALQGGRRGAIYSASKFALRGFAQALRDECSRSAIGVSIINPGMVRTAFFDKLAFRPGPEDSQAIIADDVAVVVDTILGMRPGTVIDEINLSPLHKVIQFGADPRQDQDG
jgi:short-subunit dehydrogenase